MALFEGLENLKTLSLSRTKVTDRGLIHLQKVPKLYGLDLSDTEVTDVGLSNLRGCRIYHLEVQGTKVTPKGKLDYYMSLPGANVLPID